MYLLFLLLLVLCNQTLSSISPEVVVDEIITLLQSGANKDYIGEDISQLEHALQCAQLAKNANADEERIVAALLHDLGHLVNENEATSMNGYGTTHHEKIGAQYVLARGFSSKIAELIKGHVDAKRYLTYADQQYYEKLSDASKETLKLQGGPMSAQEAHAFEQDPLFEQKIMMRSWDEQAKVVDWIVLPLASYKEMLLNAVQKK